MKYIEICNDSCVGCNRQGKLCRQFESLVEKNKELKELNRELVKALKNLLPPSEEWWCPNCKEELSGHHVTHQERCEFCGTPVIAGDGYEKYRELLEKVEGVNNELYI